MHYQAIVAGAGPAGAAAAGRLADSGLSVLVIEKESLPRVKPCGGALTARALPLLSDRARTLVRGSAVHWTFSGPAGAATLTRSEPYCYLVERQHFDAQLAEEASDAGAIVHDGESVRTIARDSGGVTVTTSRGRYTADVLIAADGAHGVSARQAGFSRPRLGAAIEAEVPADPELRKRYAARVEIHVGTYPWGYAWVIPRDDILNIGVGSFRPRLMPLKERFFAFARAIAGDASIHPLAHPLPYRLMYSPPVRGRVLAVGDAAGLMDAFSAEGIYSALVTGRMAAEAVIAHAEHGAPLEMYDQMVHRDFWPSLRAAQKMGLLFYPMAGFWARFFVGHHQLLSDYLDVAQGRIPYAVLWLQNETTLIAEKIFRRPAAAEDLP